MQRAALFIGAAALGLLAMAQARAAAPASVPASVPQDMGEASAEVSSLGLTYEWPDAGIGAALWQPFEAISAMVESSQVQQAMNDAPDNIGAFLSMIAFAEGTQRAADPYRVTFGYRHTIADLSDHPAITGEWKGERLSDAMCRGAGLSPGCVSTAAGRFQIIRPTWAACKKALNLPDFGPASQHAAAVYLIKQRGALDAVVAGDVAQAVDLCRAEWASLPGNGAGQPQRRMDELMAAYESAGGVLA